MNFCSPLACLSGADLPLRAKRVRGFTKTLLVMKLTVIFLTVAFLNVSAKGLSQQVSFSGKNVSLEEIISVVKRQTGYLFLYRENALAGAKPVTVKASNMPLAAFLDLVFQNQKLKYTISSKTINIYPVPLNSGDPRNTENNNEPPLVLYAPPVRIVITDSAGAPLSGATVHIKNKKGTGVTDAKGSVSLDLHAGDMLVISYVGHETRNIIVNSQMVNQGSLTVVLQREDARMDEIVVVNTGYQKIRPEHSTGSVSRIGTKEYEARVSTNFLDGLVNRLPGLMINNDVRFVSNRGQSSRPLFNIRGISTMSANQNPLIVVDGYPTELTLDLIDPNEIKSVTILKDAAAATVYGVRASNGVILIERKTASEGKPIFTFRSATDITPKENYSRYRWAKNASELITDYQKATLSTSINSNTWNQLATGNGGNVSRSRTYYILAQEAAKMITPEQAAQALADLSAYDNMDDYERLFLRPAVTQSFNFNVSGGNSNALYYITANYTGNRLSQIKSNDSRYLLTAHTTLKLSKKLSAQLSTDYQEQNSRSASIPSLTGIDPYERFQDENGQPAYLIGGSISPWYDNVLISQGLRSSLYYPLVDVNAISNKTHTVFNRLTANLNYNIGAGFDLALRGVYESSREDYRYDAAENSSVAIDYVNSYVSTNTDGTFKYNIPRGGFLRQEATNKTSYTANAQLNYNRSFGQHSFNGILGAEIRSVLEKGNLSSYFGYNDETLQLQPVNYEGINNGTVRGSLQLGSPLEQQFSSLFNQQYNEDRYVSGYSTLVYSYRNTYSITGSIRMDQSNLFGSNPKYKYRPNWSVGAGWNIDKEAFMQNIDWFRHLRVRASYGFNGNVAKMSLPQVIAEADQNPYTSPILPSLKLFSYANSSLRWERTEIMNMGIDYDILKKVFGSIDFYRKKSTDLHGEAQIDPTIGVSPSIINKATIKNNGIDLKVSVNWATARRFNWTTGLVLGRNISKVLDVYQQTDYSPQSLNNLGYVQGYPVGALFAYRFAGLDSAGYALVRNTKGKVYHTNDNSLGSPTTALLASDTAGVSHYMGSSIPTINAGLTNTFGFGNFYVFVMVNYYGGFKVQVPRPNPSAKRPLEGAGDYWRVKGDEQFTDIMGLKAYTSANSNFVYNNADKYVVSGDYITLADLTVSYSFDNHRFVKKAGFTHFEVKCQASNLWTVGLNEYNYSRATQSFQKTYLTPRYTLAVFTNF